MAPRLRRWRTRCRGGHAGSLAQPTDSRGDILRRSGDDDPMGYEVLDAGGTGPPPQDRRPLDVQPLDDGPTTMDLDGTEPSSHLLPHAPRRPPAPRRTLVAVAGALVVGAALGTIVAGNRAEAGRLPPKGFPKTNRFG